METIRNDKNICIGANIRRIRKEKHIGQTELVRMLQLYGIDITRESLVKIERGIQHVKASQLKAIKELLHTSYDELLKEKTEQ
ncbi:MAG: helix-turn-helix transcriptional regulator [Hungatella sp.]|nr:helix-turn-helix transcriptional regulator [Hungatella sp.]